MGSGVVVVLHVRSDGMVQLVGMQNEHVIEAFPFQATDEAFANRIRLRCSNRCLQHLDTRAFSNVQEQRVILVVSVANEILRTLTPGRCFTQLLCRPIVGGGTGHGRMHDSPSLQFDDQRCTTAGRAGRERR